ncbi:MAG: GNAT family N-acetyltransferase [Pseudomonadota bacterium]
MIRPATDADLGAIESIVADAYAPLAARMQKPPAPLLDDYARKIADGVVSVAVFDGTVSGFVILIDREQDALLENVAVAPWAQGRGIGRRLIGFAEAEARRKGVAAVRLYTHVTMVENQALYRRLGYTEVTRGQDEGYMRVQFEKSLATR